MEMLRVPRMVRRRTMTDFTAHSEFQRDNGFHGGGVNADRTRGVTGKATQNRRGRIEDPVTDSGGVAMAGRQRHPVQPAVPALAQFQIIVSIRPADERDRL